MLQARFQFDVSGVELWPLHALDMAGMQASGDEFYPHYAPRYGTVGNIERGLVGRITGETYWDTP
jgi:hypothetical protein